MDGAPTMFTFNGFGTGVYGRRDFDAATNSYVKTLCICFLFVPVLALRAYRVIDGERGAFGTTSSWYFIGRHRLSALARGWNYSVVGVTAYAILGLWWSSHTASPQYQAKEDLKRAAQLVSQSQPEKAAGIYRRVAEGGHEVEAAKAGLKAALEQCLDGGDAARAATACHLAVSLPARLNQPTPVVPDLLGRGLALVGKFETANPQGALDILRAIAPLAPTNAPTRPREIALLQRLLAGRPDDTNHAVELALLFEREPDPAAVGRTLLPFKGRLGTTEGARLLGQFLLQQGEHGDAYAHLHPYVQARLEQLHKLERDYTNAIHSVSEAALENLRQGRGPQEFYRVYKGASDEAKQRMVDDHINEQVKSSTRVRQATAALASAGQIVNVTLDLGIVQLNRAQGMTDPTARKAELEAAEKTFLAIRSFAGATDSYRMFLGQVYYWLGRSSEGAALFDELLAAQNRNFRLLLTLTETLREVGESRRARELVEEAWHKGTDGAEKFSAANFRSVLFTNLDDKITWLNRSDPASAEVQIELNNARGSKALREGDKTGAANYFRTAIAGYQRKPKDSSQLNNCGLVYFELFEVTGDVRDYDRGLQMIQEASALQPGNSILLVNLTGYLANRACMAVTEQVIRWDLLRQTASLGALASTYTNENERNQRYQELRAAEQLRQCLASLDKAMLLAPKRADLYRMAASLHAGFRDVAELRKLKVRLEAAGLSPSDELAETLAIYAGKRDAEFLVQLRPAVQRARELFTGLGPETPAPTRAQALLGQVSVMLTASHYGETIEAQSILALAREAHRLHPSSAAVSTLAAAHLCVARDELDRQQPVFAAFVRPVRRVLADTELIALVLERGGSLAELVRANAHVRQALELKAETRRRFPNHLEASEWAMIRHSDPVQAAAMAKGYRDYEIGRLFDEMSFQLAPHSGSSVLDAHWAAKMLGDAARAERIYREALARGIPLPPL